MPHASVRLTKAGKEYAATTECKDRLDEDYKLFVEPKEESSIGGNNLLQGYVRAGEAEAYKKELDALHAQTWHELVFAPGHRKLRALSGSTSINSSPCVCAAPSQKSRAVTASAQVSVISLAERDVRRPERDAGKQFLRLRERLAKSSTNCMPCSAISFCCTAGRTSTVLAGNPASTGSVFGMVVRGGEVE